MSHFKGPDVKVGLPRFQPNTSVLKLFSEALRKNGKDIGLVEGETGKEATFADILQESMTIAAGLHNAGVTAGDLVAICADKSILACSLVLGTMFSGATTAIVPTEKADDIFGITRSERLKAVFCGDAYLDSITKSLAKTDSPPSLVAVIDPQDAVMSSLLKPTKPFSVYEVEDVTKHIPFIVFSSGTTGEPKGIQIRNVAVQLSSFVFDNSCSSFLVASPMSWYSFIVMFSSSIMNKFQLVLCNAKTPQGKIQLIQKYRVEECFLSTGDMTKLANEAAQVNYDTSSLKHVSAGGEIIPTSIVQTFIDKVLQGRNLLGILFGTTEGGVLASCKKEELLNVYRIGICGKLLPGVEVKVLDDQRRLVSPGAVGELWVKSVSMTSGYWNLPEKNHQMFDKDGFYQTGDAGYFDENENLFVNGRIVDMINFQGVKFESMELEDLLMSHPGVFEVAVVGQPHPTDGEHATAYVVRAPGCDVTVKHLRDMVDGKVQDFMRLRGGVHFLTDSLPRTASGKVARKLLRGRTNN